MDRTKWLLALPLALTGSWAAAQTPTMAPVIVSATRTAQSVDEALAPVSVITREDIVRLQATSVPDVLRGLPGVAIANNGGRGKLTSLFLRGAESDQVLVLIDGVRVGSATAGLFPFQDLPIEQVERIEVVRGPRASLYGSEAIGGVVQIFTRRGGGETRPFARVTVGSRRTLDTSLGVSGGGERAWYNASASLLTTRGFNSCRGSFVAGCFTLEPDRDGYRNRSVSLRAGYRFDNGLEAEAHLLHTRARVQFDGGFQNESVNRQSVLGGKLRYSPLEIWDLSLAAGHSRDEGDSFKDSVFASEFVTRRDVFSLQSDLQVGAAHLVTVGAEYLRDRVSASDVFNGTDFLPEKARRNRAVFAQLIGNYGSHNLELAARHDNNEQFGTANTGSATWGWQMLSFARLVLSYGTAFKAPNFNELYFPGFGNANLRPESSRSAEVGLAGAAGPVSWSVNLFRNKVDDLIAFDAATGSTANLDQARIDGAELSLSARVLDTEVSTSFTALDPRNRAAGRNFGKLLPRRPRRSLRIDVDRAFGDLAVGATLVAEGIAFDDLANTRRLGGFATFDLRARYSFARDWLLQARIENLFDKRYETAGFFNQPPRGAFVSVRYQP